jgi:diguanylate cyclase (GGDEF)-like protein/PAS domain S-box-containing protein
LLPAAEFTLPYTSASAGARILLVEDSPDDAALTEHWLSKAFAGGAAMLHASSLAAGLEALRSQDIQLTMLDLDLPDSRGLETLDCIRGVAHGPVIVVSGSVASIAEEALERGAYDVICKDQLDVPTLRRVVRLARQQHATASSLRVIEGRFRTTFEQAAIGLAHIDRDGRFVLANPRLCEILGYTFAELSGMTVAGLSHPEDRAVTRESREQLHAGAIPSFSLRKRYLRKDGSTVWVALTVALVRDTAGKVLYDIACIEDISEKVRAEAELRRFRAAIDISPDLILLVDCGTLRISDLNEAAHRNLGYRREELLGQEVSMLFADRSIDDLRADYARLLDKPAESEVMRGKYRRKDGSSFPVEITCRILHGEDGTYVVGIVRDITDRKRAKKRLALHAQRQESIARFGQFALGCSDPDQLFPEAVAVVRANGADAVALVEALPGGVDFAMRAATGEGTEDSIGQPGAVPADNLWRQVLTENAPRLVGSDFLRSRPGNQPWSGWITRMSSGVYAPVNGEDGACSVLAAYAERADAFGDEDMRYLEAIANVLTSALQRERAERRLAYMAQYDALTGLPNRTLLMERLNLTIAQARRKQGQAGVLFVDLDRFKLINDSLGHAAGDALIAEVGARLQRCCVRASDSVGRISGDEFAVVLANLTRADDAAVVAQKILDALARPFQLEGHEAYVTASIGIASFPADGEAANALIKCADMAMYRAKKSARNSFCFFTAEMNQRALTRMQLSTDLRHAVERREFALHYQPKVDLASGEWSGLEALLRWMHPSRGMVSPLDFIPALEDSGLIMPVGEWVIEEACAQILRWQAAGRRALPVAVNLSAKQFLQRDLDAVIGRILKESGVPPGMLEIEITESCLMDSPEDAVRTLGRLRAAGLKISVDDFGTGYSSLAYLARFPLSALKIDRAFVSDVHKDPSAAAIVRAVIDMAQNLNLTVIAEGVETEEQHAFLRQHGCDQAQGYLFSRPVPPADIAARLAPA